MPRVIALVLSYISCVMLGCIAASKLCNRLKDCHGSSDETICEFTKTTGGHKTGNYNKVLFFNSRNTSNLLQGMFTFGQMLPFSCSGVTLYLSCSDNVRRNTSNLLQRMFKFGQILPFNCKGVNLYLYCITFKLFRVLSTFVFNFLSTPGGNWASHGINMSYMYQVIFLVKILI